MIDLALEERTLLEIPMIRVFRAALLPLLALLAFPVVAADDPAATADPAAAMWAEFLEKGDLDKAMAAYEPVFELEMTGEADKALCEKHIDALSAGARAVPVAAALWLKRCASRQNCAAWGSAPS